MTTLTIPAMGRMTTAAANTHLGYLDGLRAAAALFVVLHHIWLQAGLPVYLFGHYAVGLFIALSGFCLMLPVVRGGGILSSGARAFYIKRARRILPTYYLAMGISLLLIWLLIGNQIDGYFDDSLNITFNGIVSHLLLIHDAFQSTSTQINGPFWSIAVEWRIYFLFPLFVLLFRRWGAVVTTVVVLCGSALLILIAPLTPLNTDIHGISPQYIGLFTLGMFAATVVFSNESWPKVLRQRFPWSACTFALTILLGILATIKIWNGALVPFFITDYVVGLWSVGLLVSSSAGHSGILYRIFSWRPLVFVGTFSYSIYLVHYPLIRLFWQYAVYPLHLPRAMTFALLSLIGTPVVLSMCYLFYVACERPFITRRVASRDLSSGA
jgi:peptidoglycan/LPS O-acetylase OafA/YrhL